MSDLLKMTFSRVDYPVSLHPWKGIRSYPWRPEEVDPVLIRLERKVTSGRISQVPEVQISTTGPCQETVFIVRVSVYA